MQLTELEGAVLGAIRTLQPCTAYAVRVAFQSSPTAGWSASAGAIYPLVRRLHRAGLLRGRRHLQGRRESRRYRLTDRGISALTAWIGPPISKAVASIPEDPLRARLRFLAVLEPDRRRQVVDAALAAQEEQIARIEAVLTEARRSDDPFWPVAVEGALAVARARQAWVADVATLLDQPAGESRSARAPGARVPGIGSPAGDLSR